jgi:hypothetical protein
MQFSKKVLLYLNIVYIDPDIIINKEE